VSQLTTGKLGVHAESADAVAGTTIAFLGEQLSAQK
jgi:hypothetical protein